MSSTRQTHLVEQDQTRAIASETATPRFTSSRSRTRRRSGSLLVLGLLGLTGLAGGCLGSGDGATDEALGEASAAVQYDLIYTHHITAPRTPRVRTRRGERPSVRRASGGGGHTPPLAPQITPHRINSVRHDHAEAAHRNHEQMFSMKGTYQ
jgi:hypothetical protein